MGGAAERVASHGESRGYGLVTNTHTVCVLPSMTARKTDPASDDVVGVAPGNRWRLCSGRGSSAVIDWSCTVSPEEEKKKHQRPEGHRTLGAAGGASGHSLVPLGPLSAAQSEPPQQLGPVQENKRTQGEQRKNEEEEDEQAVSQRRVLI